MRTNPQTQTKIGKLIAYSLPLKVRTPTPRFAMLARTGRFIEAQKAMEREWKEAR
jgi:hypothetical protein